MPGVIDPHTGPKVIGAYSFSITDAPGVVAANNFLAFFVPSTATISQGLLGIIISTYAIGSSGTANSMLLQRITSASGGTLATPSTIARFITTMPDPQTQIFTNNPTVTTSESVIGGFPPIFSVGTGNSGIGVFTTPPGLTAELLPGQGVVLGTSAGNTNQRWNIQFNWEEFI